MPRHVYVYCSGACYVTGGGRGGYGHDRTWSPAANAMWRCRYTIRGPCAIAMRALEILMRNAAAHCGIALPMRPAARYCRFLP